MSKKARKHPENLCYQDGNKEYFCCPEEYLVSSRTKTYRTRLNEQPMAIQNDFPACEDVRGEPGLCVPVGLCDHIYPFLDGRINTNTSLQQFVRRSSCSSDARPSTSICCATSTARSGLEYIQHKNAAKLGLDHCGHEGFVDKILKGSETAPGRYPWMASLLSKWKNTWKTHCSGSLIHPKYVLTAAHCIRLTSMPKAVLLGEHNISNIQYYMKKTYAGPGQVHAIEKLIPNQNFNGYSSEYDIALIQLATQATLIPDEVYPICLPITKTLLMLKPKKLVVLGWGGTEKQKQSDVLQETELQLTKRTPSCLNEETFCARGKSNEGHCRGDSGGPYQAIVPVNNENDNKYVLFGVISDGARFCNVHDEQPGVGVFVGSHINWILDNLKI
ncbi:chymotrypsin-like elastase family member 2A [Sabethes cyaneus]|uniref:chymotrypsin-like elastase family member 2A n=1 Tax=Sabethes cyaneus TaxID=53552 RepID=UPI00237E4214|nr:chymotrypsin-like elastase family member 2A [Sabethes cyaneus]